MGDKCDMIWVYYHFLPLLELTSVRYDSVDVENLGRDVNVMLKKVQQHKNVDTYWTSQSIKGGIERNEVFGEEESENKSKEIVSN